MMGDFSAAVSRFVRQSEDRMDAVVKESAQRVIEVAQTPRAKGGRLPLDTGFLRASGKVAINAIPSGPSKAGDGNPGAFDIGSITLTIANTRPGDTITFGWTAIYARKMEERYAFAEAAAMEWPSIVRQVSRELEQRIRR